jgi:hypothetical protein
MNQNVRENPLSVATKWLPWCIGLILMMTVGWTAFVVWYEVSSGEHENLADTIIAVAAKTAVVSPAIVIYAILITVLTDLTEGAVVVTKRYLTNRFVKPLIERQKAEGLEEGRKEGRREAFEEIRDWNIRRLEAEKKGEPFQDPPPSG